MRVHYVYRGYFPALAGAEFMTQRLAAAMRRRGHAVAVHRDGAPGEPPPATPSPWRPEIVHAVDALSPEHPQAALALAQRLGVPFAFTPATAMELWCDRRAVLVVCQQADAVFALTRAEEALLRGEGVAASALHVIGQGPHLTGTPDPAGFRHRHGITGPMVLFLGRKMRSKGYANLLEATVLVWRTYPDACFVFLGPRWDDDCDALFAAHADPRIIELGHVSEADKHSALAACALLCLPSTADVFPLACVEAWACGKPVITSTFSGVGEVVQDGQDGLVVSPDPGSLAAAIAWLLSDAATRSAMGARGLDKVQRQFNWEAVADRVERVYAGLLTNTRWGGTPS